MRAALWRTNGWDAARAGEAGTAARAYVRSLRYDPLQTRSLIELAKLPLRR